MKTDLITTILTAIAGTAVAYFVCGLLIPEIDSITFKTLNSSTTYNVSEPDPEIFNYRAINPTVETIIHGGQCDEYDEMGRCISIVDDQNQSKDESDENPEEDSDENPEENPEETPEDEQESPDAQPSDKGDKNGPTD